MPDHRQHRGPHPDDRRLFGTAQLPVLRAAVHDLSWLLTRSYALPSALKLVGDRYQLDARQRLAVSRCACADHLRTRRKQHQQAPGDLAGNEVWIDGYNVLITMEAALSAGVILKGRDGCLRDLASMHGSYRQMRETQLAIESLGNVLASWQVSACRWLFDQSVSNSGRLRQTFLTTAARHQWNWTVDLAPDPDPLLANAPVCVASADSQILDVATSWVALATEAVVSQVPQPWIVDLSIEDDPHN